MLKQCVAQIQQCINQQVAHHHRQVSHCNRNLGCYYLTSLSLVHVDGMADGVAGCAWLMVLLVCA